MFAGELSLRYQAGCPKRNATSLAAGFSPGRRSIGKAGNDGKRIHRIPVVVEAEMDPGSDPQVLAELFPSTVPFCTWKPGVIITSLRWP